MLFARKGLRLEEYCKENQIPYIPFEDFSQIKREFQKIMKEDDEKTGGQGVPARFNPRANMWRRISSKQAVSSPDALWVSYANAWAGPPVCCCDAEGGKDDAVAGELLRAAGREGQGQSGLLSVIELFISTM